MSARRQIDTLFEGPNAVMRFDANARLEVFITQGELEDEVLHLGSGLQGSDVEKIALLKQRALALANEKVSQVRGVEITSDLSLENVNLDRIDWVALVNQPGPEPDDVP